MGSNFSKQAYGAGGCKRRAAIMITLAPGSMVDAYQVDISMVQKPMLEIYGPEAHDARKKLDVAKEKWDNARKKASDLRKVWDHDFGYWDEDEIDYTPPTSDKKKEEDYKKWEAADEAEIEAETEWDHATDAYLDTIKKVMDKVVTP